MAQLITVRLSKSDHQPLGFRLQGGKDFGTPLAVQKVNGGSAAERAGLQAGDALIRVNSTDVYTLRHQEAQDAIRLSGPTLELTVQRGGGVWKPSVTPQGSLPRPGSRLGASPAPVTCTSLKSNASPARAFGSGHNNVAKPFGYANGNDSKIVNKQYNTPVNMYSDQTIAETLSAQTEVLAGGVLGVNFKKNEKTYDAEKSAVFKVLQEEQNDPEPEVCPGAVPVSGLRHVAAPAPRADPPLNTGGLPVGQNICEECERLITGVFVRIKDKNLHVECFKCATCGASLKNQGYYNLNGKLYCDIHAKLVARQNTPAPNLEPVTVPPGGRIPTNAFSTPLPPLSTNNYSNGSSSMFSPCSAASGPKPFGSSLGSTGYSPASLSPRSAPLSPARPAPPTNDVQSGSTHLKTEFKSPAEERLFKKMAKMALNGYEIGIQRKCKPADHIQSMADRIQDTVVTKHPLNSESSFGDNSTDNNFSKSVIKSDRGYKTAESIQNIGDKIKATILSKHPMAAQFTQNNVPPPPPPIPDSPIPSFNIHSTPISNPSTIKLNKSKYLDNLSSDNNMLQTSMNTNGINATNGNFDKVDTFKTVCSNNNQTFDKAPYVSEVNTPKTSQYDEKLKNNQANTLNKQKIFDTINRYNGTEKTNFIKQINGYDSDKNFSNIKSSGENKIHNEEFDNKPNNNLLNLSDNTFYNVKYNDNNETHINNGFDKKVDNKLNDFKYPNINGTKEIKGFDSKKANNDEDANNEQNEPDVVVKRRQKRTDRNSDGRRDSHIVARPMSRMTSADVTDGLYPVCHVCDEAINRGPFITALGRIWCPDHFICVNATCRRPLQDIGFVEENGQLYCEYCFEQYIAPACDKCHAKIKGDCLNAIGKHFHPECFNCVYCGKLFGNNPFFLEDGLPYCEADWNELFTTKCFACGFPVEAGDRWVEALNNNYHSQCFNCTVCKKNLEGQSFFAKGGRPFCKMHAR